MEKIFRNYILLGKTNDSVKIDIIRADPKDDNSEEVGFVLSGIATTFDVRNENGGVFQSGDFDKSIRDYFKKNRLNMICPIEHAWDGFDNRGVFRTIENETDVLKVEVEFYKDCCSLYDVIKGQVKRGILQGFSTYGWINDSGDATLLNISLVANPADEGAKLFKNTKFIGFDGNEKPKPEPKKEIKNNFIY